MFDDLYTLPSQEENKLIHESRVTKSIIYTAKITTNRWDKGLTRYLINRYHDNKDKLISMTNYLLANVSDDGSLVNHNNSEYEDWINATFINCQLYFKMKDLDSTSPPFGELTLKEFKETKLMDAYQNLLLSDDNTQMRYAVQYCNHDNFSLKMIACDILRNKDIIVFKNKQLLKYIILGKIDQIEDLML